MLARIRVALRRTFHPQSGAEPRFHTGLLSVDFARRQVELDGQDVSLTPTEFDLLKVFIIHRGKILTRQMLLKEVWGTRHMPGRIAFTSMWRNYARRLNQLPNSHSLS